MIANHLPGAGTPGPHPARVSVPGHRRAWCPQLPRRFARRHARARGLLAALLALAGLFNILSALAPRAGVRIAAWHDLVPVALLHGSRTVIVLAGCGLLLARGLWHGRRVAWLAVLALLGGTAVAHLVKGFNVVLTQLVGGLLAALLADALAATGWRLLVGWAQTLDVGASAARG